MNSFKVFKTETGVPIKAWVEGVPMEEEARLQLERISEMPFIYKHIAVMPDVHFGLGATIGSVVPTRGAIIPAAVGVDIGCGMCAVKTSLTAEDLPDDLKPLRLQIERDIPIGSVGYDSRWKSLPPYVEKHWAYLVDGYIQIVSKHSRLKPTHDPSFQLGTLGSGNHFIEICLDETNQVWVMLHSGSRGVGNRIGQYFIELAKRDMETHFINLPDKDLSYLSEGTAGLDDYCEAVAWAQLYAHQNRAVMMTYVLQALKRLTREFRVDAKVINCHHNYVDKEHHFGQNVFVTRKGAVRARRKDLGIIPGSMGTKSYIVEGKGNEESFQSCSHGAGRVMSRNKARAAFSIEDHAEATKYVECRKDKEVLDETPGAYKDVDAVIAAQSDLITVLHTLKQVVCVKG